MAGVESPPPAATPAARGPQLDAFYRSLRDYLAAQSGPEQRFWLLVIATGAAAGLGAVLLLFVMRAVQHLAWPPAGTVLGAFEAAGPLQRVGVLVVAGALVSASSLVLRRRLGGHGTAGIIEAIWLRAGRYSLRRAFTNGVVAIVGVALGTPLGREGALISTGAGTGSAVARRLGLDEEQTRVLVACGAASGIAAAYNVPLGAALFGLEVLLGSFALEFLGPIIVSCVTATLVSRVLVHAHPAYVIPYYRIELAEDFFRFLLLAPVFGLVSIAFNRLVEAFAVAGERVPGRWAPLLPPVALALVGLVAIPYPQVLGNGYDSVNEALLGNVSLSLVLVLPVLKALATATASGAGVPGGLFTPTLFVGALIGVGLGAGLERVWPSTTPVGVYALVGMAAVLAGTTHAAVSSVLIIFEMTRDYGVILPLMAASVVSAMLAKRIDAESIYTSVLRRRGVKLPERPRPQWLRETTIAPLVERDAQTIAGAARFTDVLIRLIALEPGSDLYVLSRDGRYEGALVLDALKGHLPDRDRLDAVIARDVMDASLQPVRATDSVADAARRFATTYLEKLPVVDEQQRLVGTVSKRAILRAGRF